MLNNDWKSAVVRITLAAVLIAGASGVQTAHASSMSFGWVDGGGGPNMEYGTGIALDDQGNVYSTVSTGTTGLIQKHGPNGNLIWWQSIPGTCRAITLDASGNLYVVGGYSGTADFEPGPLVTILTSAGSSDAFVLKFGTGGDFIWAKGIGGTGYDYAMDIAVDGSGNLYVTGYYSDTADFDPGPGVMDLTSAGAADIFVAKLDSAGNLLRADSMGGPSDDEAFDIALDQQGSIYVTGYFRGIADFDPSSGIHNLTSTGEYDIFISKLGSNGSLDWASRAGEADLDNGMRLAVDEDGNVYAVGYITLSSVDVDIYFSKWSSLGALLWEHRIGGEGFDAAGDIELDGNGYLYLSGEFAETVDFDPGPGTTSLTSAGAGDIFFSKFDLSGNFISATRLGGIAADTACKAALDPGGNLYLTGYFSDTVDFDPGPGTHNLTSAGNEDIFISKLILTPQIHYVNLNATGTGDGSSWENAYTDLQSALAASTSGDEIWVAAGTYKPTAGTDRAASFTLKSGVAVYGGFAGTESVRSERNFETNVTILSGDIGAAGNNSDNSYHVVVGSHTNSSAILDGFTISAGNANDGNPSAGSTPEHYGGGMFNQAGSPTLANLIFSDNTAYFGGGGMFNGSTQINPPWPGDPNGGSHPALTNVVFNGNTAREGGGMRNEFYSSPHLTHVIFTNNTASRVGGGVENTYFSSPTLVDVIFDHNSTPAGVGVGGGMVNTGSDPSLTSVTFSNNTADWGGAMANGHGSPALTNVTFTGNSATSYGGAIYNLGHSSPILTNVTISGNTAVTHGGAIYSAPDTPGLTVRNSILHNNSGGEIYDEGVAASVTYSIVQGGYAGDGNLNTDPLLGPLQDNGGLTQTMALGAGSPAIDAANDLVCPTADQRGLARPQGDHCDIGAYEYERVAGTVRYVKWDATGANSGTYWDDAYTDLQSALAAATSGDEIWVAAGTYKPTTGTDRTVSFVLKNGVWIYGGFAGTEGWRSERDPAANLTTLSGDIGVTGNNSDNSYHVVAGAGMNRTALLDGFTITGGNANGEIPNRSGGGVYISTGIPTLTNLVVSSNTASDEGGGMAISQGDTGSIPTLTNITFSNNTAYLGGGLEVDLGSPNLVNVTFSGNSAAYGGGMLNRDTAGTPRLTNVTFSNNSASVSGGAVAFTGSPTVRNSIFWGDTGGEISSVGPGAPDVTYSIVQGGYAGTGNLNVNPVLNPLQNNGGFTPTLALGFGSPAIDAADGANCPAADQRGAARPQDGNADGTAACDIGAYEYQGFPVPTAVSITSTPDQSLPGEAVYVTVTVSSVWATPVGTVDLSVDGVPVCPALMLDPDGRAHCTMSFAASGTIQAAYHPSAPNYFQSSSASLYHIVVTDATPPLISSIVRANPDHTSATSVNLAVTFSEPVTGIDTGPSFSDFALATTGVSGAAITGVNTSDNRIYTVTVNTGSGNGTIRLDVPATASIKDMADNSLAGLPFTGGETYTIEKTPIVGAGTYDDTHAAWIYSSGWTTYTGAGPANRTSHYTNTAGREAQISFDGNKFKLTYVKASNRGLIDVYVDGTKIDTINAKSTSLIWQATWTSPILTPGIHNLRFVHAGGGTYIDIDAIQVFTPLDIVAPAAITDLSASTGTTTGAVNLSWTAPGDDGSTGTAASYLVRYSSTAITNESEWNAAIPVTTGLPAPVGAGNLQTMTVSGLTPGTTYYFAVRAQDEEPNTGGLSNSPSAAAQSIVPVAAGIYDDTDVNWVYTGSWTTYNGSGPRNNTSHYTNVVGNQAQLAFNGAKFKLTYVKASNRGLIDVYVDGTRITTLNAYSATTAWQATWTSPALPPGVHTVGFVHAGGRTYIDIDAIQIFDAPPPPGAGIYDDTDPAWVFSSGWATYTGAGPANNTLHFTNTIDNDAQFTFDGAKFKLTYVKADNRGLIDVYVDGTKIDTIDARASTTTWQAAWTSPVFTAGVHTVRFVHAGGGNYVDIDAIQVFAASDTIPPAAITDLAAVTGTTTGAVNLSWTAPGDDGSSGTATAYLVRYSTSPITSETEWNAAAAVTTGLPLPVLPGTTQTMTVSGLTPDATYYFAVRAQDEEPNTAALSNSPSAAAQGLLPITAGTYDDTDVHWIYSGAWTAYTGSGPLNGTWHTASSVGSEAQITFSGTAFTLTYVKASNRGSIDVYVDGTKVGTINAKSTALAWQQTWNSPAFTAGVHTIRFVHAGGGTYIDVDAITILP